MEERVSVFYLKIPENIKISHFTCCLNVLDEEEQVEFNSYLVEHKKIEFLFGRLLVKSLFAQKLNLLVYDILLKKNSFGKPYVKWEFNRQRNPMYFNLSHTSQIIVCGIAKEKYIGIDVEKTNRNYLDVMDVVFCKREINLVLDQIKSTDKKEMFFRIWTRKEALLKARGTGLYTPPLSISVPENSGIIKGGDFLYNSFLLDPDYIVSVALKCSENKRYTFSIQEILLKELIDLYKTLS
ncbi:4'-phosphopantetheinyl transferase superfamily protein (plasmid) [Bacillus sp. N5-665]|uniref:4'-phosphopantetheinyl transferase family protein n=1 Tax=Bacillus sp. N5-665 TaxID=2925318 RepID=UPI001F534DA2|nr:4'-phosphopantetheinyl transferase superfamily protein [Bacillus sp. N5-665]UNK30812.1 4'-phosphopantetheinyl transferase superfamily protein [Bacillus sp. N5-665]